jgi:hypothetical protein
MQGSSLPVERLSAFEERLLFHEVKYYFACSYSVLHGYVREMLRRAKKWAVII